MSVINRTAIEPVFLLRISEVTRIRGRSRSAHYQDVKDGLFPHPVPIGVRAVAHPENEVAEMNAARIAGKSEAEIRALVVKLEAARKSAS